MKHHTPIVVGLVCAILLLAVFAERKPSLTPLNEYVRIETPQEGDFISSPLVIKGEARGHWFFEATFPVTLVDENGVSIAEHYAEAQGEWMTEEFVPFTATLEFTTPQYGKDQPDKSVLAGGTLILHRSNASGLPEHDDAVEISIRF
jgi:hypothetical protein